MEIWCTINDEYCSCCCVCLLQRRVGRAGGTRDHLKKIFTSDDSTTDRHLIAAIVRVQDATEARSLTKMKVCFVKLLRIEYIHYKTVVSVNRFKVSLHLRKPLETYVINMIFTELPEWSMAENDEDIGTFDSSGAFLSVKVTLLL